MSAGGNGDGMGGTAPSAFSVYASRFLAGTTKGGAGAQGSQIFRPPSPTSPSHDPFITSPTSHTPHPHLPGGSSSPSPTSTPPFPGAGLAGLPDIDDAGDGVGVGLLFSAPSGSGSGSGIKERRLGTGSGSGRAKGIPNPYAPSSSDSEVEADLDEVATVRRSLVKSKSKSGLNTARRGPPPVGQTQAQAQGAAPLSERAKKGWLAHQSIFPPSSSSGSGTESETESEKETESESEDGRVGMMGRGGSGRSRSRPRAENLEEDEEEEEDPDDYMLSPSELHHANVDMQEPLLGPDELDAVRRGGGGGGTKGKIPVRLQVYHGRFGHWEREGLRKYKDSGYLALWLTCLLGILISLPFVWGSTDPPPDAPSRSPPSVLPLLPLLLLLLIPTLALPPLFLLLLRRTVRPVLLATAIFIPFSLFLCGWWAIGASFETSGLEGVDQSDRWWSTTGLRLVAVFMWALAALFGRLMWGRRKRLERTVAVVELSTELLLSHPPLLLLTPLLLGVLAITSIPFLTLLIRLGMIGYWRHPRENTWVFHIRPYAGWLIFLVSIIFVWTWGVIRGVGRVAVAAVVGEWYFHQDESTHPAPLEITTAAVHRATGTSLGSICLGALIVATVRVVGRSAAEMKRLVSPKSKILPSPLGWLTNLTPVFSIIAGVLDQLNGYALVYVGITGDGFWPSARRAVGLAGRRKGGRLLDYTLIKLLLTLSSTVMGLITATAGYLYMTHTLSNPAYAPVAALLCGGVPFLAIRAGAAVLGDAADALFICYQIDRELGGGRSEKAKAAFEGEVRGENAA